MVLFIYLLIYQEFHCYSFANKDIYIQIVSFPLPRLIQFSDTFPMHQSNIRNNIPLGTKHNSSINAVCIKLLFELPILLQTPMDVSSCLCTNSIVLSYNVPMFVECI